MNQLTFVFIFLSLQLTALSFAIGIDHNREMTRLKQLTPPFTTMSVHCAKGASGVVIYSDKMFRWKERHGNCWWEAK